MQPESGEPPPAGEHIVTDIHEILRRLEAFEQRDAEFKAALLERIERWEKIAAPFARLKEAGRLARLGKGHP